jgi:hypothetical protein
LRRAGSIFGSLVRTDEVHAVAAPRIKAALKSPAVLQRGESPVPENYENQRRDHGDKIRDRPALGTFAAILARLPAHGMRVDFVLSRFGGGHPPVLGLVNRQYPMACDWRRGTRRRRTPRRTRSRRRPGSRRRSTWSDAFYRLVLRRCFSGLWVSWLLWPRHPALASSKGRTYSFREPYARASFVRPMDESEPCPRLGGVSSA